MATFAGLEVSEKNIKCTGGNMLIAEIHAHLNVSKSFMLNYMDPMHSSCLIADTKRERFMWAQ